MTFFPIFHILFWIALATGPHDMSKITVEGPASFGVWTWTKQESGWIGTGGTTLWTIEGKTVIDNSGNKSDKKDVSQLFKDVAGHDWSKSASLDLGQKNSLIKVGDTFVYTMRNGGSAEMKFIIEFKK